MPFTAAMAKIAETNSDISHQESNVYKMPLAYLQQAETFYDSINLELSGLNKEVFIKAYRGYLLLLNRGLVAKTGILTIADLSQSSRKKRLYVIDLDYYKLLFNTYVSHGKNSGGEMATKFSNKKDSYQSTLGFLLTSGTYIGCAGYSLRLKGMEPGINDNVLDRDIVVHGSKFVNEKIAAKQGRVGNSMGCPAVPMLQNKPIINTIKGGSVYFIYNPNEHYNTTSKLLNTSFPLSPDLQLMVQNIVEDTPPVPL